MAVLDIILIEEMVSTSTTVNTDFATDSIRISNRQDEFAVQINYDNGSSVNMNIALEVSNDNVSFSPMATQNITDDTGSHIFDVTGGTGTVYLRVTITVITGSIDLQVIRYTAKRLH